MLATLLDSIKKRALRLWAGGLPSFKIKIAALLFSPLRADYYRYLADIIQETSGRTTLKDILGKDARRYEGTLRGFLSTHWASRFDEGGWLAHTFEGTIPKEDVAFLVTLQQAGGVGALEGGFRDLAKNTALFNKARNVVAFTFTSSGISLALLIGLVFAMPGFTVPKLAEAFTMLPAEYYPPTARHLFGFADFISSYWVAISLVIAGVIAACWYSLPNLTGPAREFLNKYGGLWGMYRDFHSISFLSGLSAIVKKRGNGSSRLREAIAMQEAGASKWKMDQIKKMLAIIDSGNTGSKVFSTGILEKKMEWFLADLIESRGLDEALQFVRARLEDRVIRKIEIRSVILSWLLMLLTIAAAAYLMFWHIEAVDDMKTALQNYLA